MKRMVFVFSILLMLSFTSEVKAQDTAANKAFKVGERLEYRVYYHSGVGNVTAGEAILTVDDWKEQYTGDDKTVFHFTGIGNSKGLFNFFFKVRDKFESFVDQQTLLPYVFLRETREGGYKKDDTGNVQNIAGSAGFVIPPATLPGNYRIRMRTFEASQTFGPCGNLATGETEDYILVVVADCAAKITSVVDGSRCDAGTVVVTSNGSVGTTQYRYYSARTGGSLIGTSATTSWTTPSRDCLL